MEKAQAVWGHVAKSPAVATVRAVLGYVVAAMMIPLVIATFMLYFKTAPPLGVIAFFMVLIIGVLLPQLKADSVLSHLLLKEELREELRDMIRKEAQESFREKPDA